MSRLIIGKSAALVVTACFLMGGCQSGESTVDGAESMQEKNVAQASTMAASKILLPAQQDALNAFNKGDKRLLGVQTRGVSVPGVDDKLLPILRDRYGVALRRVNDVVKDDKDRNSLTEVFQYVREYNGKMAELLSKEL